MMKKTVANQSSLLFSPLKTVSVETILAAGDIDSWAKKELYTYQSLKNAILNAPQATWTNDEIAKDDALLQDRKND